MRKTLYIIFIAFILLLCLIVYKNVTNKKIIYNSLVRIESSDDDSISSGFGFVYKINKNEAYVVTNYHVVEGYFNIYIYDINNDKTKAKLVNYDINNDIAVLSINNVLDLKKTNIGNSDNIKINDKVYILGNPSNYKNFKSSKEGLIIESLKDTNDIYDFKPITISSSVDYGNSGSPVLDKSGKLIGMIVLMKKDDRSTCLAIPINYIVNFINENKLDANRPSLGAVMASSSNISVLKEYGVETFNIDGVVILKLSNESILNKKGLKVGDIITSFNGVKTDNINTLKEELYKLNKGDIVNIEYYSDQLYKVITLRLQ